VWLIVCIAVISGMLVFGVRAEVQGIVRVIDGDTLDVGDARIRLYGIDAPETDQSCVRKNGTEWACGAWVARVVADRYQGRVARCDAQTQDRYGRLVATCRVAGEDIGRSLVEEGLAFAYRRYSQQYVPAENRAKAGGNGLHAYRVTLPEDHRRAESVVTETSITGASAAGCVIKGNISASGERIFHAPGQQHYARTSISLARGERWFCSAAEARAAGWRAARR
jgi:endonuclease YncB( thermonuclease family)